MKTSISLWTKIAAAFVLVLSTSVVQANESGPENAVDDVFISDNHLERIRVEWVNPESFTDVRQTHSSREKFRKHVFVQLEKHLDELAKDLPIGQRLKLSVTDLDLAGRIEVASFIGLSNRMDEVRVMRNIDIPRLTFAYELVDANGKVLKSDDVHLKNMNYLQSAGITSRNRPFAYEKIMLSKWFAKNFVLVEV